MSAISIDDPRQESLFEILPRAIADAVKGGVEIAVINAPIHVDEFTEGYHVYAPRIAIEGRIIYRKLEGMEWEIDALVSPSGSVFFTRVEDTLESVRRHAAMSAEDLKHHDCREAGEYSWWEYDAQGIPLCRVCDKCKKAKLSRYRPCILSGYTQADVDEPIDEEGGY